MHQIGALVNSGGDALAPIVLCLIIDKDDDCEYQLYTHNSRQFSHRYRLS